MSDKQDFELPLPTEKLSYKFILDSLKEDMKNVPETRVEKECGKEAPKITLNERFPEKHVPKNSGVIPDGKKYFRIGEAAEIIGVEAYVLRYWESEFKSVKPTKSNTGHRVYSKRDVETLLHIRHLLHEERFSIKGAKQKLLEQKKEIKIQKAQEGPKSQALKIIHQELRELISLAKLSS